MSDFSKLTMKAAPPSAKSAILHPTECALPVIDLSAVRKSSAAGDLEEDALGEQVLFEKQPDRPHIDVTLLGAACDLFAHIRLSKIIYSVRRS